MRSTHAIRRPFAAWLCLVLSTASLGTRPLYAQEDVRQGTVRALKAADYEARTSVPFLQPAGKTALEPSATFNIVFSDNFPAEARTAFEYAASIWALHISSAVPIDVEARWDSLGEDVLGSAGPVLVANIAALPFSQTWYPKALAKSVIADTLFTSLPDIDAVFSSEFDNWYFGTDARPPVGTYDFVTVVLHELGHGLGFTSSADIEDDDPDYVICGEAASPGQGCWGLPTGGGSVYPYLFDRFVEDGGGTSMLDPASYPNPSDELATTLQGGQLHFDGTRTRAAHLGMPARLFAPSPFDFGSSVSHLDEDTYPQGNLNSLMTPYLARSEAIHIPGSLACAIGEDMGWAPGPRCVEYNPENALTLSGTPGRDGADRGWRMLASPVEGTTRESFEDDLHFQVGSGNLLYTWANGGWVASSTETPLPRGSGFILYLFDDEIDPIDSTAVLDAAGDVPDTAVDVDGLELAQTFFLLGNPYASGFDLAAMDLPANGFQSTVQVWDPAVGSFRLLTADDGVSGDLSGADVLSAWQGFFAERSVPGAGAASLSFPLAGKVDASGPFYGKTAAPVLAQHGSLGLRLVRRDAEGREVARDEAVRLYLSDAAGEGWDAYDAAKLAPLMTSSYAALSFPGWRAGKAVAKAQESRALALTGRLELPLAFEAAGMSGAFEISWPEWQGIPEGWTVKLLDTVTGEQVDLRAEPSYTFSHEAADGGEGVVTRASGPGLASLSAPAGTARFRLVVEAATGTAGEAEEPAGTVALRESRPNPARGVATIEFALASAGEVRLALYDVLGREMQVLAEGPRSAGVHRVSVDAGRLASGTYVYRLVAGGRVFTRSLVVVR